MTIEFELLHSLRVKGLAKPEVLSALSGVAVEDLESACAPLVEAGTVLTRPGAMGGFMLTPAGKAEAERLLREDAETREAQDTIAQFDNTFLPVNTEFKKICHRWQLKGDSEPNDHQDLDYDRGVVGDLEQLHVQFAPSVDDLGRSVVRFSRYSDRLSAALDRVKAGDTGSFARPMYDSYHDIWMELHNDVVLSLGRERGAADEH